MRLAQIRLIAVLDFFSFNDQSHLQKSETDWMAASQQLDLLFQFLLHPHISFRSSHFPAFSGFPGEQSDGFIS